jgi:hypothetical protein
MQKTHLLAAAACAAIFTLAACNSEPEVITVNKYDPMEEALKNAPRVEAPPMMQASRTYRCRDNSLVFIDFYTNNTAHVRLSRDGTPTVLTAQDGNPPFTAPGYSVSANANQISLTAPGKGTLSCRI